MDNAVGLVDAYFRANGFLTVTEYPILHHRRGGVLKEVTDLDVLAYRLPYAGRVLPRPKVDARKTPTDPVLDLRWGRAEMIIAEVKEGVGAFNAAMFQRAVLFEAMRRFGGAPREELEGLVEALGTDGEVSLQDGTRVRLMAFGSRRPEHGKMADRYVSMSHVVAFLRGYVRRHDEVRAGSGFRDPVLGFLALLDKADPPERR